MLKSLRQRSIGSRNAGMATVEMALILPLFLLVTFGLAEFGLAWLTVNTMNHAAREAVRLAAVTPSLAADDSAVVNRATTILANAGITGASVTNTAPIPGIPPQVAVNIALTYTWLTQIGPLFGFSFTGTIPLASTATMRYER
jgi:Flp pilus assembly protein TadG